MDKTDKFLLKIRSRNHKRQLLKEKRASYSKLINIPEAVNECLKLKEEINFLENELSP